MPRPFAILVLAAAANLVAASDPGSTPWLQTASHAYVAMPANAITDGQVRNVSWSPDGEHIIVASRPITTSREAVLRFDGHGPYYGSLQLMAWDRRFHQIRTLWSTDDQSATIEDIAWLASTSSALITVRWVVKEGTQGVQHAFYGVLAIDAASGKYRWAPGMEHLPNRPFISASPTRPIAAAVYSDIPSPAPAVTPPPTTLQDSKAFIIAESITALAVTSSDGKSIRVQFNPTGESPINGNNFETLDSTGSSIHTIHTDKAINKPLVWNTDGSAWFLIDTADGNRQQALAKLTDAGMLQPTTESQYVPKATESDLTISQVTSSVKQGKTDLKFSSVWLVGRPAAASHGECLLAADGTWPELSPTDGAVFYIEGGVAKVQELIRLSDAQRKAAETAPEPQLSAAISDRLKYIYVNFTSGGPPEPAKP